MRTYTLFTLLSAIFLFQTFTFKAYGQPIAVCKEEVQVSLPANGVVTLSPEDIDDGSTGFLSMGLDIFTFTCDALGEHIVTLTIVDNDGNADECTSLVVVMDKISPVAICDQGPITVHLDSTGMASITPELIDDGSFDNCDSLYLNLNRSTFGCTDVGENQVTLTATDMSGNSNQCMVSVNVIEDGIVPFTCPDEFLDIELEPGQCDTTLDLNWGEYCDIAEFWSFPDISMPIEIGLTTHLLNVVDSNGDTTECVFIVGVNEYSDPNQSLACEGLIEIEVGQNEEIVVGAEMLLEGGPYGCYENYWVELLDADMNPIAGNTVTSAFWGDTLTGVVTDPWTGNQCWSQIAVIPDSCTSNCTILACAHTWYDSPIEQVVMTQGWETGDDGCILIDDDTVKTLAPTKEDDWENGVDLVDLVLINLHLWGIVQLNPYQLLAADLDYSNSVTVLDALLLTQIIQGDHDLDTLPSWQFVDADFDFPDPECPFCHPFPSVIEINHLPAEANFIGIKKGDLFPIPWIFGNQLTPLTINAEDQTLNKGETYDLVLQADDFDSLMGMQIELEYLPEVLEVLSVEGMALSDFSENNYTDDKNGKVKIYWASDSPAPVDLSQQNELLKIRLKATGNHVVSQSVRLSGSGDHLIMKSDSPQDIFTSELTWNNVISDVDELADSNHFGVEIYPNPVKDQAIVKAINASGQSLTFTLTDPLGRDVYFENFEGEFHFDRRGLSPGWYFYRVENGKGERRSGKLNLLRN